MIFYRKEIEADEASCGATRGHAWKMVFRDNVFDKGAIFLDADLEDQ
jgi:hypothetical protein